MGFQVNSTNSLGASSTSATAESYSQIFSKKYQEYQDKISQIRSSIEANKAKKSDLEQSSPVKSSSVKNEIKSLDEYNNKAEYNLAALNGALPPKYSSKNGGLKEYSKMKQAYRANKENRLILKGSSSGRREKIEDIPERRLKNLKKFWEDQAKFGEQLNTAFQANPGTFKGRPQDKALFDKYMQELSGHQDKVSAQMLTAFDKMALKSDAANKIKSLQGRLLALVNKGPAEDPSNNDTMLGKAENGQKLTNEIYDQLNDKNDKHGSFRVFFEEQKKTDEALVKTIKDNPDLFKGNPAAKENFKKLLNQKEEYLSQISSLLKEKKIDQLKFAELRRNLAKVNTALSMALINSGEENTSKAA